VNHGWIGVDLDGTLAVYDGWRGPLHIGPPVPAMVQRVKQWVIQDIKVRIMTARVSPSSLALNDITLGEVTELIDRWCLEYIGRTLPVTCEKDMEMVMLWDDRCTPVEKNTGRVLLAL